MDVNDKNNKDLKKKLMEQIIQDMKTTIINNAIVHIFIILHSATCTTPSNPYTINRIEGHPYTLYKWFDIGNMSKNCLNPSVLKKAFRKPSVSKPPLPHTPRQQSIFTIYVAKKKNQQ